ncbi:DDE family transposase [Sanguibacter antarcticus]|uniref:DDE family transposase n=1 Tax=Sanguibacter antarcticus TaxID=372484 RepID=A0A2A9E4L7_9MICO|nr:DDE family transposase [Sanguibacter antarcticus]
MSTFKVKSTVVYPRLDIATSTTAAVSQAGGVLLTETIRASGLDRALGEALLAWRKPTAVHDPGKVILDLAVALALGGDALADIAVLRAEPGLYGPVDSDPTVSRVIAALAADALAALRAINTARARARSAAWRLAGGTPLITPAM